MENQPRNIKNGFEQGFIDGIQAANYLDKETREAEKDISYFIGNMVIGIMAPWALANVAIDILKGNYNFLNYGSI